MNYFIWDNATHSWIPYNATALVNMKAVNITRDMTAATGDVSYTGVGFTPTFILFHAYWKDTSTSVGSCDSAKAQQNFNIQSVTATRSDGTNCIKISDGTAGQSALVKSFDADGFTLTWTKSGTPAAATARIDVYAFK